MVDGRRVVLFRGLNVGRSNRLTMDALREVLVAAGCRDVRTHLQSGNAVVRAVAGETDEALAERLGAAVSGRTDGTVEAHVIGVPELRRAVARNPYPEATVAPQTVQLFFLAEAPDGEAEGRLADLAAPSESFVLDGRMLYLHAPDGIGRSKLVARAERLLSVSATARNWRTVTALLTLAEDRENADAVDDG
ncbi:MAG: DUF1697 domain-containing protein [Deinococcus-Thermus bacterium]|jgi:uncharacterized protein (DUF1697 family)|nr:DUF1697 domain-containing protein [Deinococcota bacterium]